MRAQWDGQDDNPILYEDETLYNYIVVRAWGSERHLKLNEGVGIHSVFHPDSLLSQGNLGLFSAGAALSTARRTRPA